MTQARRYGRSRWVTAAVVVAVLALAQAALAAQFSADMVMTGRGPATTGKIYVQGTNVRTEMTQGQRKQIMIMNASKKTVWMADPKAKTYWEQKLSDQDLARQTDIMKGKLPGEMGTPKRVGTETVNGYVCDKMVSEGKQMKATIWLAKKLKFPIKSEMTMAGGMTARQEFKNIKEGPQPAALFGPPAGYKKVQSPMAGMGGMMQGRSGGMRGGGMGRGRR